MYFEEINNRILLSVVSWIFCTIINYIYLDNLIYIVVKPCQCKYENDFYFIFTDVSEPFYTNLRLILATSNQILYFGLYYQIISFIRPGLYMEEYKSVKYFTIYGAVLFLVFLKINYSILIPWSFFFFFFHQKQQKIDFFFEAKMNEYVEIIFFSYKLSFVLSIVCLFLLLLLVNNTNFRHLNRLYRKYFYIIIVSIASIITPPDVISQLIISFVMIFIFEIVNYTALVHIKLLKNYTD